ncbi:MAG TPA: hypothetical protein DDZ91_00300 [Firmicutes bacterium]|nr:hypothetical protein [Bacillota bacterium]
MCLRWPFLILVVFTIVYSHERDVYVENKGRPLLKVCEEVITGRFIRKNSPKKRKVDNFNKTHSIIKAEA